MATKKKESVSFEPSTEVLTAEVSVQRKTADGTGGKVSGVLYFGAKQLEVDLSMYRKMSPENWRTVGKGLLALAQEAEDALDNL